VKTVGRAIDAAGQVAGPVCPDAGDRSALENMGEKQGVMGGIGTGVLTINGGNSWLPCETVGGEEVDLRHF